MSTLKLEWRHETLTKKGTLIVAAKEKYKGYYRLRYLELGLIGADTEIEPDLSVLKNWKSALENWKNFFPEKTMVYAYYLPNIEALKVGSTDHSPKDRMTDYCKSYNLQPDENSLITWEVPRIKSGWLGKNGGGVGRNWGSFEKHALGTLKESGFKKLALTGRKSTLSYSISREVIVVPQARRQEALNLIEKKFNEISEAIFLQYLLSQHLKKYNPDCHIAKLLKRRGCV